MQTTKQLNRSAGLKISHILIEPILDWLDKTFDERRSFYYDEHDIITAYKVLNCVHLSPESEDILGFSIRMDKRFKHYLLEEYQDSDEGKEWSYEDDEGF